MTGFVTGMPAKLLLAPNTAFLRAPDAPVRTGSLRDAQVLLAIFGFLVIAALLQRCVRGAILFGVLCLIYYVFDLPHR